MAATITAKQYIALRLWYVEGWTQYQVAHLFGVTQPAVHGLISRGRRWIFETACADPLSLYAQDSLEVEGLLRPSPSSSVTHDLGKAASRQEELLDALELLMEQRADALAVAEMCMSNGFSAPTHVKRSDMDQWETHYAATHHGHAPSGNAYNARTAAHSCAEDPATCRCACDGCRLMRL